MRVPGIFLGPGGGNTRAAPPLGTAATLDALFRANRWVGGTWSKRQASVVWFSISVHSRSTRLSNADAATLHGLLLIGQLVYEGRRRAGITQRQLGRVAGVNQSTISRLERGRLNGMRLKRRASILASLDSLAASR